MLRKPLLVGLCVVVWVLFWGVFLGVAETIVGSPVCCCVGIVLWSVSCVAETIVGSPVCCYVGMFCGVFLSVAETIVGSPVCCCVGIVLWIKLTLKTVDEDPASCKRWISRKEIKSAKI